MESLGVQPEFSSKRRREFAARYDISPFQQKSVFSPNELNKLESVAMDSTHRDCRPGAVNIMTDEEKNILPIIEPKIQSLYPDHPHRVHAAFYLSTYAAPPHIDNQPDPDYPSLIQFLIPVKIFGRGKTGSIVFFDQKFWGPGKHMLFRPPENLVAWQIGRETHFENYRRETNFIPEHEKALRETNPKLLEGLSVREVFKYSPGDLIGFSSTRLHCSGSLIHDDLLAKLSVLVRVHIKLNKIV